MSQNRCEHDDVEKTHWYSNEGFNRLSIWRDSLAAYYERIQTLRLSSLHRRRASHPQAPSGASTDAGQVGIVAR
jgi:hypothetical protein